MADLEPGALGQQPQDVRLPEDRLGGTGGRGSPDPTTMAVMRGEYISLYDQEHQRLVRFLMNVGAGLPAAEDAMQETFADAWALVQSGSWEAVENPAGWIRAVGLRKYHRHRGRAGKDVPVPDFADAPAPGPCPADLVGEARTVLEVLHSLPPTQRTALALQIDGFSCRETADYLGITEQQAADLRKKARKPLASQMNQHPARRQTP